MNFDKKNIELLAPAGNMQKLITALHFGADAVYLAGKRFGLRAQADNFNDEEINAAAQYVHTRGKKLYAAINIYPETGELDAIAEYAEYLQDIGIDGVIVSDLGVFACVKRAAPKLELHVSTQANVTNAAAAEMWADLGVKRIVLARELTIDLIADIRAKLRKDVELEAFVHGAMCIAYSGRCLLSSYFTGRGGNSGQCVQCCRWEYGITELSRGDTLRMTEDERGTYILSSRDLCMIEHLDKLIGAGITSMKIEGRVKSEYYVGGAVNAYRRALDAVAAGVKAPDEVLGEVYKISHRGYTTGFYLGEKGGAPGEKTPAATHVFTAVVLESIPGGAVIEMRNKFSAGDELEVLSPGGSFNKRIRIGEMRRLDGSVTDVADQVQEKLVMKTDIPLDSCDILRKKLIKL